MAVKPTAGADVPAGGNEPNVPNAPDAKAIEEAEAAYAKALKELNELSGKGTPEEIAAAHAKLREAIRNRSIAQGLPPPPENGIVEIAPRAPKGGGEPLGELRAADEAAQTAEANAAKESQAPITPPHNETIPQSTLGWKERYKAIDDAIESKDYPKAIDLLKKEIERELDEQRIFPTTEQMGLIAGHRRQLANAAQDYLIAKAEGLSAEEAQKLEVRGALNHARVGDIDLVWGKAGTGKSDGWGLAKIVKFHPEVLNDLQKHLDSMEIKELSDNRIILESPTHKGAIRLELDGEKKTWLLTEYEKRESLLSRTTDEAKNPKGGELTPSPTGSHETIPQSTANAATKLKSVEGEIAQTTETIGDINAKLSNYRKLKEGESEALTNQRLAAQDRLDALREQKEALRVAALEDELGLKPARWTENKTPEDVYEYSRASVRQIWATLRDTTSQAEINQIKTVIKALDDKDIDKVVRLSIASNSGDATSGLSRAAHEAYNGLKAIGAKSRTYSGDLTRQIKEYDDEIARLNERINDPTIRGFTAPFTKEKARVQRNKEKVEYLLSSQEAKAEANAANAAKLSNDSQINQAVEDYARLQDAKQKYINEAINTADDMASFSDLRTPELDKQIGDLTKKINEHYRNAAPETIKAAEANGTPTFKITNTEAAIEKTADEIAAAITHKAAKPFYIKGTDGYELVRARIIAIETENGVFEAAIVKGKYDYQIYDKATGAYYGGGAPRAKEAIRSFLNRNARENTRVLLLTFEKQHGQSPALPQAAPKSAPKTAAPKTGEKITYTSLWNGETHEGTILKNFGGEEFAGVEFVLSREATEGRRGNKWIIRERESGADIAESATRQGAIETATEKLKQAGRARVDDSVAGWKKAYPATGEFGTIYRQFHRKPDEAIAHLLKTKEGEAEAALYHKDVGEIDLVWGKEGTGKSDGWGLAKIAKFHPEVLVNLQEILGSLPIVSRSNNRVVLETPRHRAIVSLNWKGKDKIWLLTEFEFGKSGAAKLDGGADTLINPVRNDAQVEFLRSNTANETIPQSARGAKPKTNKVEFRFANGERVEGEAVDLGERGLGRVFAVRKDSNGWRVSDAKTGLAVSDNRVKYKSKQEAINEAKRLLSVYRNGDKAKLKELFEYNDKISIHQHIAYDEEVKFAIPSGETLTGYRVKKGTFGKEFDDVEFVFAYNPHAYSAHYGLFELKTGSYYGENVAAVREKLAKGREEFEAWRKHNSAFERSKREYERDVSSILQNIGTLKYWAEELEKDMSYSVARLSDAEKGSKEYLEAAKKHQFLKNRMAEVQDQIKKAEADLAGLKEPKPPSGTTIQSSPHAGGAIVGAQAGWEEDEDGNIRFNPAKAAIGAAAGLGAAGVIKRMANSGVVRRGAIGTAKTDNKAKFLTEDGKLDRAAISSEAVPFRELKYTFENFKKEFANNKIKTPIGEVGIHDAQFTKLGDKGRTSFFGLMKPTLESPLVIVRKEGSRHFIKPFVGKNGEIMFHIVTKGKDSGFVASGYAVNSGYLRNLLKDGEIIYKRGRGLMSSTAQAPTKANSTTTLSDVDIEAAIKNARVWGEGKKYVVATYLSDNGAPHYYLGRQGTAKKFSSREEAEAFLNDKEKLREFAKNIKPRPTEDEIRQAAKEFEDQYDDIGVRTQNKPFKLGELKHKSNRWDDGTIIKDDVLDGVSATHIGSSEIKMHARNKGFVNGYYSGDHTAIIGGNNAHGGEDIGEIVISDPRVLKILRSDPRMGSALVGAQAGWEQDEDGNIRFNPAKAAIGAAALMSGASVIGRMDASGVVRRGAIGTGKTAPSGALISKATTDAESEALSTELRKRFIRKDGALLFDALRKKSEPFRPLELTEANFKAEFPNGKAQTPIGEVNISEYQAKKLTTHENRFGNDDRVQFFGLIKPTLENPLFVSEFEDAIVFVKPFRDQKGQIHFVSVAKEKDGAIDVVSNYDARPKKLWQILQGGKVKYVARPKSYAKTAPEPPTRGYPHDGKIVAKESGKSQAGRGRGIENNTLTYNYSPPKSETLPNNPENNLMAIFGLSGGAAFAASRYENL